MREAMLDTVRPWMLIKRPLSAQPNSATDPFADYR